MVIFRALRNDYNGYSLPPLAANRLGIQGLRDGLYKPVRFEVKMPSEIIVSDGMTIADAALFAIQVSGFFCK